MTSTISSFVTTHGGWLVVGVAIAAVLAATQFTQGSALLASLLYFVAGLCVVLPVLAIAYLAQGRAPLKGRIESPEGRALCLAIVAFASSIMLPWCAALFEGGEEVITLPSVLLVTGAIALAARQLTGGWAILTSIALIGCCWVGAILSHAIAEWVGWQDLHWREVTGEPIEGSSHDIAWGFIGAAVFAPIAGIVLGIASQVNKRERVAS